MRRCSLAEAAIHRRPALAAGARALVRMGDLSTNIAEEVIYLIEGEIVRHARY